MRDIHELLQLVLDNMHLFKRCLCDLTSVLAADEIINFPEMNEIDEYIRLRNISSGTYYPFLFIQYDSEPRIEWLKAHIELNSDIV